MTAGEPADSPAGAEKTAARDQPLRSEALEAELAMLEAMGPREPDSPQPGADDTADAPAPQLDVTP